MFSDLIHEVSQPLVFYTISWILLLKKTLLTLLTDFLKLFQSDLDLEIWYAEKFLLHFLFYYPLECLVILTYFECLSQSFSVININSYICYILSIIYTFLLFYEVPNNIPLQYITIQNIYSSKLLSDYQFHI